MATSFVSATAQSVATEPACCEPSSRPARIESIQWLRGVAALLVLFVHAVVTARARIGDQFTLFSSIPNLDLFGCSGVDLFFVISGFVMAHSLTKAGDVRSFLVARWWRIWPLFVLASALFIVSFGTPDDWTLPRLLPSLLILPLSETTTYHQPALDVGWTLGFEAMFYLLVAATIALRRGAVTLLALTSAAATAGLLVSIPWAPARMLINPIVFEFAFGIVVWLIWSADYGRATRPLLFAAGILLLAAGIAGHIPLPVPTAPWLIVANVGSFGRALAWGVPWALIVLGLLGDTGIDGLAADLLRRLGDASYSIYLFHFIIIDAIGATFPLPATSSGLNILVTMTASVAAGLMVHRWIERPLLRARRSIPPWRPRTAMS